MKITVDLTLCQGHGRCVAVAPDFFDFADGAEQPSVLVETDTDEAQIALAQRAARACPERAIKVEDV